MEARKCTRVAYVAGIRDVSADSRTTIGSRFFVAGRIRRRCISSALATPSVDMSADEYGAVVRYEPKTISSGYAPLRWSLQSAPNVAGGAMDAAADWIDVEGSWWLSLGSSDEQLVREMRLVALEVGLCVLGCA
jgi:hypothetical protein